MVMPQMPRARTPRLPTTPAQVVFLLVARPRLIAAQPGQAEAHLDETENDGNEAGERDEPEHEADQRQDQGGEAERVARLGCDARPAAVVVVGSSDMRFS